MTHPKISVVMTVYNTSDYLAESVESILNQTFEDFEFIIVDDCSTDESWKILSDYADRDPRIVLERNSENLGPAQSSNKGLAIAQGDYIARFDSDDISLPDRLQKQVSYMDAHPSVALISAGVQYIDESGAPLSLYFPPLRSTLLKWQQVHSSPVRHPTVFWRRKVVEEKVGNYDPNFRYSLDYDFLVRVSHALTVETLPLVLVNMRLRQSSISSSKKAFQDSFASQVTHRQLDFYFSESPLSSEEKTNLRALLRRYKKLQSREFLTLDSDSFQQAASNYLILFERFCSVHASEIDGQSFLHREVERDLSHLYQHCLSKGWTSHAARMILSYLRLHPKRLLPVAKNLITYSSYSYLKKIGAMQHVLNNFRAFYFRS